MGTLQRPILYCVIVYALYVSGLGNMGFVGPDEPRYADVARAMMRSGDYITPHLYGAPWFEKPPLYYWLTALTFHLGISEVAARIPSAFAAAFFLGFWFWFAKRFYGDCAAKFSCLMLASTAGWIGFARAAAMDMLLTTTLATALGLLALWLWEQDQRGLYGFYATLGLATLAKGPLAVALAGMVVLGYVIHRREWGIIPGMLRTPAVLVFAVIALPWYIACYARNGYPFIQEFFIKHNFERLVSAEVIGHPQPLWFYLPILPAALFPWTPALLLPIREIVKQGWRRATEHSEIVLLLYWVALPFLFFSLSANKLPGYLLPILPPLTLWIGHAISLHWDEEADGSSRIVKALLGVSVLLLMIAPLIASLLPEALATGLGQALSELRGSDLWRQFTRGAVPLVGWMVTFGLVVLALILLWRRRMLGAVFAGVIAVAWMVLLLTTYLSSTINRVASVRTAAQSMQSRRVAPHELAVFFLNRNQVYGLGYYMDGLPPEWAPEQPTTDRNFLAARDDIPVEKLRPGAYPLTLFPGQHMRLWELNPAIEIIPMSASAHQN